MQVVNISGEIIQSFQRGVNLKYKDTRQLVLGNIPAKYKESSLNSVWIMGVANLIKAIFSNLTGMFKNTQGGGNPKCRGTPHPMLGKNPVKFQDSGSHALSYALSYALPQKLNMAI